VRFNEASLGRFEPETNPTRGKAREKPRRHPHGELLLDNADAVIDALHLLNSKGSLKTNQCRSFAALRMTARETFFRSL
jgi:hypothetical protein